MNTIFMLMANYESVRLNLDQTADFMGVSRKTLQNKISLRTVPFAMYAEGSQWFADLRDVADYLDRQRAAATAAHEQEQALLG